MNKVDLTKARLDAQARRAARPGPGRPPNSRQPVLVLPTKMPNGRHSDLHPFLWLLQNRYHKFNDNKSELARMLGVDPHTIYKWERQCAEDPNFPLPVIRAGQLAGIFQVPASLLRPDVPWSH